MLLSAGVVLCSKCSCVLTVENCGIPRLQGGARGIGCLKLQIIFRKRASMYRVLLRKMTCRDKTSYDSTPPCKELSHQRADCRELWHSATTEISSALISSILFLYVYYMYSYYISCTTHSARLWRFPHHLHTSFVRVLHVLLRHFLHDIYCAAMDVVCVLWFLHLKYSPRPWRIMTTPAPWAEIVRLWTLRVMVTSPL